MRLIVPILAAVSMMLGFPAATNLYAQAEGWREKPTPACALLSASEISKAAGRTYPEGSNGDNEGEGIAGGSGCTWGGASIGPGDEPPMVGLALIRGKSYTTQRRAGKPPQGCKVEPVQGVGDEAFFESCPKGKLKRTDPLYVKAGANDLIIEMDVEPPATEVSARQTVIAMAKAAVANLH
jgi:hypothetical protein